ncbi:fumarylacetoacetate hydrolase family protein [Aquabacter cavernae]|uniref:fumarylacetoacetate hydrolase family protein n=1 Tax=Aquabacter cavernae TaxID=2496029 RepID=UPI000F8C6EE8|nr:fumarylacetoacetate hydrolase family protein [Aquabacter cavernae]
MTSSAAYAVAPEIHALPVAGGAELFAVRRIYCVGRNYLDHIREMQEADERDPPFFFQKPTDSLVQNGAIIPYPPYTDDYQHEIELVVAIGRAGRDVPVEAAEELVFGYAVGLEMTRRDRQKEARERSWPWEMGKSFDQSAPCGPIHPVAEVGHPRRGAITLAVNGTERQRGDLAALIWNVPEIIANLSRQYELKPGDLIFTGTPAGVGPLVPGDRLDGRIEGLGTLTVTVGPKG